MKFLKFLNKIFSFFTKRLYRGICRAMIISYYIAKEAHPNLSKRELYALALSTRPRWKRVSKYSFQRGERKLIIEENDTFENVVMDVIYFETKPSFGLCLDSESRTAIMNEIVKVLVEEFKNFKE